MVDLSFLHQVRSIRLLGPQPLAFLNKLFDIEQDFVVLEGALGEVDADYLLRSDLLIISVYEDLVLSCHNFLDVKSQCRSQLIKGVVAVDGWQFADSDREVCHLNEVFLYVKGLSADPIALEESVEDKPDAD